jgi:hypothetical protein
MSAAIALNLNVATYKETSSKEHQSALSPRLVEMTANST